MKGKVKVAVVLEWHPMDVVGFSRMFRAFRDLDCYVQSLEMLAKDEKNRQEYATVLFYNLSTPTPAPDDPIRMFLEGHLGRTGQGIFLLHHGLLSYPQWSIWAEVSGLPSRAFTYHPNQTVTFEVAAPEHPIVRGLRPWTMEDETYRMNEPDAASRVILKAKHPQSLEAIAWTRTFGKSRVFCYASGHDQCAYEHLRFREIVHRGLLWTAGRWDHE
jgi:hypothetical protein